ncbi:MAG: glycosyltransferase family 1 protein [Acidimicrobiales bacterium]
MRVAMNLEQILQPSPGGIGRYTARLAAHLPAAGVDVAGFCALHRRADVTAALAAEGLAGLPTTVLPLPRPALYDAWHRLGRPDVATVPGLRGVDVVFAPSVAVPPRRRHPLVVTVHDAAPCLFPDAFSARGLAFHRAGLAAAARRADLVLTVSQSSRAELVEHTAIPDDRIRVVANGVDLAPATDAQAADLADRLGLAGRPYVLWVGSLEPRKNVEALLGLPAALAAAGLPHRVVLAGPQGWGPTARRARSAAAAAPPGSLRLLGPVAPADLAPLYRGAALFCFPSLHEGFGLPVLEAMAQGTPVLCSSASSLPEVAGAAARYVAAPDPEAWAAAVVGLLGDEVALAALGAGGPARAAAFGWPACAAATAAALREAVGAG